MQSQQGARRAVIEAMEPRRLLTVLAPDLSFHPPLQFQPPGTGVDQAIPVSKGRYIVISSVTDVSGGDRGDTTDTYRRLFADGMFDPTFGTKGKLVFDADLINVTFTGSRFITVDNEHAVLNAYTFNGKPDESVGHGTGTITLPFKPPTKGDVSFYEVGLEHTYGNGGMLVLVDLIFEDNTPEEYQFLKLNADATLDKSFGDNGIITIAQPKAQLNEDFFGKNGFYVDLLRGYSVTPPSDLLMRFTANGKLDTSFGDNGTATIAPFSQRFQELPNGKIEFMEFNGGPIVIHRLNNDGTPDKSFNSSGSLTVKVPTGADTPGFDLAADQHDYFVDAQGRTLVATGGTILRYTTSGKLDSYPFNGTVHFDGLGIAQDKHGNILTTRDADRVQERDVILPFTQLGSDGVAQIFGTFGNDTVSIRKIAGDRLQFVVNGETTDLSASKVKQINIDLYNGANVIDAGVDVRCFIHTSAGRDAIVTGGGNDTIRSGGGSDTIHCGGGNDIVTAGGGDDFIVGGAGNDSISGGDGRDTLFGGAGNDTLTGDAAADRIYTNNGNDHVFGGGGDDRIFADYQSGNDTLSGGSGNDVFVTRDALRDLVNGDGGTDRATIDAMDVVTSIEI